METNNTTAGETAQNGIKPIYATEGKTLQDQWFGGAMVYVPVYFVKDGKEHFVMNACYWTHGVQESRNKAELEGAFKQLNDNDGRYFAFYSREKDIFKFIDWVKSNGFSFEHFSAITRHEDYMDFAGNLKEYSAAFSYRIYDEKTVQAVIRRLPVNFRIITMED